MVRGGKRVGAGRKSNSGTYQEPTIAMRVPASMEESLREALAVYQNNLATPEHPQGLIPRFSSCSLPLFSSRVEAGFPSPADDSVEGSLDLNEHLINHPAATFFLRASGESMLYAGIHSGDLLVVDRSLTPRHGHVVIAALNGEPTVKRLHRKDGHVCLVPDNPHYPVIEIPRKEDLHIWGVVTSVIHTFV